MAIVESTDRHFPMSRAKLPPSYVGYKATFVDYYNAKPPLVKMAESGIDIQQLLAKIPRESIPYWEKQFGLRLRDTQLPPSGDWFRWLVDAGRGFGKTETGTSAIHWARKFGGYTSFGVVSPTAGDIKKYLLNGPSGLLQVCLDADRPEVNKSDMVLTWHEGGDKRNKPIATANLISADRPERLRGGNYDFLLVDELCSILYDDFWPILLQSLRKPTRSFVTLPNGKQEMRFIQPRCIITTTPRKTKNLLDVLEDPSSAVTVGSTFENLALAERSIAEYIHMAKSGSKLMQQELFGAIVDLAGETIFNENSIKHHRIDCGLEKDYQFSKKRLIEFCHHSRGEVIISIDPAVTSKVSSDETGILALGRSGKSENAEYYLLGDHSLKAEPREIARIVAKTVQTYGANKVIYESNQGGEYIRAALEAENIRVIGKNLIPYTAASSKAVRATAAAVLYDAGRVHHVGLFPTLEKQMLSWIPGESNYSPDRMDALSNGLDYLSETAEKKIRRLKATHWK